MFIDLIRKRRSIRKYQDREVEKEKIDLILEAALRSPSSRSLNPWEFVVVKDRELIKKLSKAKEHGSSFLRSAPLAVVVCADPERCDVWVEDCSIASIIIQLQAQDLGLGSCWVQIRKRMHDGQKTAEEYVRDVIGIPGNIVVESIIGIGYPAEDKPPHPFDSLQFDKVHYDKF